MIEPEIEFFDVVYFIVAVVSVSVVIIAIDLIL